MRELQGLFQSTTLNTIKEKTRVMFVDPFTFTTPEALIIYEQKFLDEDELLSICKKEYGDKYDLKLPKKEYIPKSILSEFKGLNMVPISYSAANNSVLIGVLPELPPALYTGRYSLDYQFIPIYSYTKLYTEYYGRPDFLKPLTSIDYWSFIVDEALRLGASDITLANEGTKAVVFYNVRKRKVHSNRVMPSDEVLNIARVLAMNSGNTFSPENHSPRYFDTELDPHNRGRVVVNKTFDGWSITIRILPNDYVTTTLEELNIDPPTCKFVRDIMLSPEKGLRLFIGETMSGKNTSILASILELANTDKYKIVIIGNPIESLIPGAIQISVNSEEEFALNADSLLRQNPDLVYFTEITEKSAQSIMKQANTSKAVFSTIHANSVSDVVSRLCDITSLSPDRIVMTLQSCVYQELVRDEEQDKIFPVTRCIYFSTELKDKLYGKSLAEILQILRKEEKEWEISTS